MSVLAQKPGWQKTGFLGWQKTGFLGWQKTGFLGWQKTGFLGWQKTGFQYQYGASPCPTYNFGEGIGRKNRVSEITRSVVSDNT